MSQKINKKDKLCISHRLWRTSQYEEESVAFELSKCVNMQMHLFGLFKGTKIYKNGIPKILWEPFKIHLREWQIVKSCLKHVLYIKVKLLQEFSADNNAAIIIIIQYSFNLFDFCLR